MAAERQLPLLAGVRPVEFEVLEDGKNVFASPVSTLEVRARSSCSRPLSFPGAVYYCRAQPLPRPLRWSVMVLAPIRPSLTTGAPFPPPSRPRAAALAALFSGSGGSLALAFWWGESPHQGALRGPQLSLSPVKKNKTKHGKVFLQVSHLQWFREIKSLKDLKMCGEYIYKPLLLSMPGI